MEIINNLIPVYLMFLLGYAMKRLKVISEKDGKALFVIVYNALTPAMFLYSIPRVNLSLALFKYPITTVCMQMITYFVGSKVYDMFKVKISKVQFMAAVMILNCGFILPFYASKYGYDNIWQHNLFELGNAIMVFLFIQYFFMNKNVSFRKITMEGVLKILKSPPIIAIFTGIIINLFGVVYPKPIENFLYKLAILNGQFVMLGLGIYFNPRFKNVGLSLKIIFFKLFFGIISILIFINLFSFDDSGKTLVYLIGSSPVGTTLITFSAIYNEDLDFASGLVSMSLMLG